LSSFGSELQSIAEEIREHLHQALAVTDHRREARLDLTADRYLSGEPLCLELFQRVGEQGLQLEGLPSDAQCAGFDARDIEQIRDQPLHRPRATLYDPDGASPVIAFSALPEQRFDAEGDRMNGIAQVVRDYGE